MIQVCLIGVRVKLSSTVTPQEQDWTRLVYQIMTS